MGGSDDPPGRRTELRDWLPLADQLRERDVPNTDEDQVLALIMRDQGFDGPPARLVDEAELDRLAAASDGERLWRGLFSEDRDAAEYAEQFRSGPLFVGQGVRGNGVYFARDRELAEVYVDPGGMIAAVLPGNARRIAGEDLTEIRDQLRADPDLAGPLQPVVSNLGRLAAALGFDAIVWAQRNLVVVLNRTALIVAR